MIRSIAIAGVLLVGVFSPLGLFVLASTIYAVSFSSLELIIIAGIIDAYYGYTIAYLPISTFSVLVVVVIVEWVRPSISLYNQ